MALELGDAAGVAAVVGQLEAQEGAAQLRRLVLRRQHLHRRCGPEGEGGDSSLPFCLLCKIITYLTFRPYNCFIPYNG